MIDIKEHDSFVFNRILMELTDNLPPDLYKTAIRIFLNYGFNKEVEAHTPLEKAFLNLAKSVIDDDNKE